jgi:hypothetical protein
MKSLSLKMAFMIGMGASLLTMAVRANAETLSMRFDVPFAFVAGGQVLPAGMYEVRLDGAAIVDLRSMRDSHIHRLWLAHRIERKNGTDLGTMRFQNVGDRMTLEAIWGPWRTEGFELKPSNPAAMQVGSAKTGAPAVTLDVHAK